MAESSNPRFSGAESIEALTADRMKMWHSFTNATTGVVIFMVILLLLMAFFLL